jgi:HSP20 family protein
MTTMTPVRAKANTCGAARAATKERIRYTVPAVDLCETDKAYVLAADVPGATHDGVDLRVEGDDLIIEVKADYTLAPGTECSSASLVYKREFALGRGLSRDDIQAELKHGVLTVTLPKVPERQPRQITVKH